MGLIFGRSMKVGDWIWNGMGLFVCLLSVSGVGCFCDGEMMGMGVVIGICMC